MSPEESDFDSDMSGDNFGATDLGRGRRYMALIFVCLTAGVALLVLTIVAIFKEHKDGNED